MKLARTTAIRAFSATAAANRSRLFCMDLKWSCHKNPFFVRTRGVNSYLPIQHMNDTLCFCVGAAKAPGSRIRPISAYVTPVEYSYFNPVRAS